MKNRDKLYKANIQEHPELRGQRINETIEKNHPNGDEIAILRKTLHALIHGLPIPQEFEAYYAEAEKVKTDFDTMVS